MPSENRTSQNGASNAYEPLAGETPSEAVITAVADATGQSPLDLRPLIEVVNPGALNAMVDWNAGESAVSVSFEYAGHRVTVSSAGVWLESTE